MSFPGGTLLIPSFLCPNLEFVHSPYDALLNVLAGDDGGIRRER